MAPFEKENAGIALEGDLKRIRPEEILQFIGVSEKTGVLSVEAKEVEIEVHFRMGRIVASKAQPRGAADISGQIFVRTGVLDEENLAYALDVQRRSLKRLGTILVELGYATNEQVGEVLSLQVHEDVLKFMKLAEGPFRFRAVAVEEERFTPPVPVEQVLLDCLRVNDEWRTLAGEVPPFSAVPKITDASGELFTNPDAEPLSRGETVLYDLIDGSRTLRQVVDLSRLGDLEGAKAVTRLIARGYVVVQEPARHFALLRGFLGRAAGPVLALALLTGLLGAAYAVQRVARWSQGGAAGLAPAEISALNAARVENCLEIFRLVHGVYPDGLDAIVESGCAARGETPETLRYAREGDGYTLRADPGS